ncbi:hypothetical protein YPPY09_4721, partial [Yersinia pestis PY-09]
MIRLPPLSVAGF